MNKPTTWCAAADTATGQGDGFANEDRFGWCFSETGDMYAWVVDGVTDVGGISPASRELFREEGCFTGGEWAAQTISESFLTSTRNAQWEEKVENILLVGIQTLSDKWDWRFGGEPPSAAAAIIKWESETRRLYYAIVGDVSVYAKSDGGKEPEMMIRSDTRVSGQERIIETRLKELKSSLPAEEAREQTAQLITSRRKKFMNVSGGYWVLTPCENPSLIVDNAVKGVFDFRVAQVALASDGFTRGEFRYRMWRMENALFSGVPYSDLMSELRRYETLHQSDLSGGNWKVRDDATVMLLKTTG